ncbi:MAG: hypothetical protein LBG28_09370 [Tannerella sp.]|nr:hypothetical protein [Tannerella sp.]
MRYSNFNRIKPCLAGSLLTMSPALQAQQTSVTHPNIVLILAENLCRILFIYRL